MIFADALPKIKTFLKPAGLAAATAGLLLRLIAAFLDHTGRMSASQAANALRSQQRHRAQLARFLARQHWSKNWSVLHDVAGLLLEQEHRSDGTWIFILDQTYVGQQGQQTENTFSRANSRKRPKNSQRRQKKGAKRSCHGFVMGLLLTPSGYRIPCCRCYYTKPHCQARKLSFRKQTELAAQLIRTLVVPVGAQVVVLGDTAFEAAVIRQACDERQYRWIVPLNPERVLAGPQGQRPRVTSLVKGLSATSFAAVRLEPGRDAYAAQRRLSRYRVGPKVKARTFYVHQERRQVHNVGDVQLVFSTTKPPQSGQPLEVQKILISNGGTWTAAEIVQLYTLRWQVELFFKELKSTLGFAQYRFRQFAKVEGWTQACLVAFCYLEWYRARQLARHDVSAAAQTWWGWQRSHGVSQALRQEAEDHDLSQLLRWSETRTGLRKLRRGLRAALTDRKPQKNRQKRAA
jgi:hypothetical protein